MTKPKTDLKDFPSFKEEEKKLDNALENVSKQTKLVVWRHAVEEWKEGFTTSLTEFFEWLDFYVGKGHINEHLLEEKKRELLGQ